MRIIAALLACTVLLGGRSALADCSVPDLDNDGFPNTTDNCPTIPNPLQTPGVAPRGDACDDLVDVDGDTVADGADNCPHVSNSLQEDSDAAGSTELVLIGDACCQPVVSAVGSFCVAGNATGVDFSWAIDDDGTPGVQGSDTQVPSVSAGAANDPPATIAANFAASITTTAPFVATPSGNCFAVSPAGDDLWVGPDAGTPDCKVAAVACSFNPTIRLIGPNVPALDERGLVLAAVLLLGSGLYVAYRRHRRAEE